MAWRRHVWRIAPSALGGSSVNNLPGSNAIIRIVDICLPLCTPFSRTHAQKKSKKRKETKQKQSKEKAGIGGRLKGEWGRWSDVATSILQCGGCYCIDQCLCLYLWGRQCEENDMWERSVSRKSSANDILTLLFFYYSVHVCHIVWHGSMY